jgi:MoaA/NifB/PqqE/SkfB family radical SAM enzyme
VDLNIMKRISTDDIHNILNKKPKTRQEYIEKFEASYNFGPQDYPPQVFIELTSICNLKCSFCGYPGMNREKKLMDEDLAKKVIDECADHGVWYLTLQFYGEPLTVPDYFARMIAYAKSKGIVNVNTTSNMVLMTPEIMRTWIDAGLDTLNISFDAAVPKLYEKNRGANYEKVLNNIIEASRVIKEYGNDSVFTSLTHVITEETAKEIEALKKLMAPYVKTFDIRKMLAFDNKTELSSQNKNKTNTRKRIPCREIGPRLIVASNGEATICCSDVEAELSIGNVNEKSIKEIWNSDEMARICLYVCSASG